MEDIWSVVAAGDVTAMQACLDAGMSINDDDPFKGWTPLHHATFIPKLGTDTILDAEELITRQEVMVRYLIAHGAALDAQDVSGNTALMYAVAQANGRLIQLLCETGANVNLPNKDGHTPLHFAAEGGHPDIIQILRSFGADITVANGLPCKASSR